MITSAKMGGRNKVYYSQGATVMLKSTNRTVLTLDAFVVRAYIESLEFADMSYGECMNLIQEVLELPQYVGIPLGRQRDSVDEKGHIEDFSAFVCERMIEAGFSSETAWKCRNSAAAKSAAGVPVKTKMLKQAQHTVRDLVKEHVETSVAMFTSGIVEV